MSADTQADRPSPYALYLLAGGGTPDYDWTRYRALLIEYGHLIPLAPGETAQPLPCGWPGPPRDDHDPEENHG